MNYYKAKIYTILYDYANDVEHLLPEKRPERTNQSVNKIHKSYMEETKKLLDYINAKNILLACYSTGNIPTEKLFKRLEKRLEEGKQVVQDMKKQLEGEIND